MKSFLTGILFLSSYYFCLAQDDRIEPERPGETQTASTVGKKTLQLEAGIKVEKTEPLVHHTAEPELVVRFGVIEKLELRLETTVSRYSTKIGSGHTVVTGFEPIALGFKTELLKGNHWIPQAALIADVTIPSFSSEQFKTDHAAPHVRLAFHNDVNKKIQLGYNIAVEWDGEETQPEWIYTFSPCIEISPACQLFVEAYGHVKSHESPKSSVDGGVIFFINKNISVDVSSGFGISKQAPEYFVSLGGAIRFK